MDNYTKQCLVCGNEFGHGRTPSYLADRKYCSNKCAGIANRTAKMATLVCIECGKEYQLRDCPSITSVQKYCSRGCRNTAHPNRVRTDTTPCKYCGKAFTPYSNKGKLFCSQVCHKQYISIWGGATGASDETIAYIRQHYPNGNLEDMATELQTTVSAIRNLAYKHNIYRSDEAMKVMYEATSERMSDSNPMKRPEVTAKVEAWWANHPEERKAAGIKAIQANHRDKPSKLELRCAEYLTEMGFDYEHQAIIKDKFVVDFRMGNIILQCDGDYWHGHKRFEPLTERQLKQQKRDAAQDKYLQACGYTVIRVWECDMSLETLRSLLL